MKIGDIIEFKNLEWYVIDTNKDTTRLLLKDVLDEEHIKDYVYDEWYRNGSCVRHNCNVKPPFDWNKSYIKNVVLPNFKEDLGIDCEVDLLSKEEVENLPNEIRKCNDWYWTKTNASDEDSVYAYAFYVYSDGGVFSYNVDSVSGLRPVISISSELLKSEDKEQENKTELEESKETMICTSKKDEDKNPFADLEEFPSDLKTHNETQFVIIEKINELIKTLKEK